MAVYNHYLRLLNCTREPVCQLGGTVELEKSNILMAGPGYRQDAAGAHPGAHPRRALRLG